MARNIESRALSHGGRQVTRLCFGCEQLGGTDWGDFDEAATEAALEHALELGIDCFDTAAVYSLGRSEARLAAILGARRHDVLIATKIGYEWAGDRGERAATRLVGNPLRIRAQVAESLRRLRLDCVPLCYLHRPDPNVELERTIEAMRQEQEQGRVRLIGCSNFARSELARAAAVARIDVLQVQYSLIDRAPESDLLPYCLEHGIAVFVYGCLGQGMLTGKVTRETRFPASDRRHRLPTFRGPDLARNLAIAKRVTEFAAANGKSAAQCATRWVLDHEAVTCAIAGAKTTRQIADSFGALDWQMTSSERESLTHGSGLPTDGASI